MKKERGIEADLSEQPKPTSLTRTDKVLAFVMGLIVVIMFLQVFFRYALNNSLTWTEEITRFLFIWAVFLGTAINIRDRWNIGVDVVASLLPKSWARYFELFDEWLVLAFLLFLVVTGFIWIYAVRGTYSSAVELPINIVLYAALPVTSLLGVYYCVRNLIKGKKSEGEEREV